MLVSQNWTGSLQVQPGLSTEMFPTSSDGACTFSNIEVEEDVVDIGEVFTTINEEANIGIKQEQIPEDINFPDIKSEPDEVSYMCICLLLDIFFQCTAMGVAFVMSVFLAN